MENEPKEKLRILHVGADPEFLSPLVYESFLVEIETVDNLFSVSQWILENGLPDGLICDKNLPGGNVSRFYDFWLSQFNHDRRVPFILLKEQNCQECISKELVHNCDAVFAKPIRVENILKGITVLRNVEPSPHDAKVFEMDGFKPSHVTFIKRSFDILSSAISLVVVSPLLLISIIAIRLESKGNVFYTTKRVGTGFKVFDFYKLRTMYHHSDQRLKELAHLNENVKETGVGSAKKVNSGTKAGNHILNGSSNIPQGDTRITKVGSILRKLNIDELPQLFNVIKGDLSLVGNRPLPIYEAELLTTDDWTDRFHSPAGVTGIWKVVSRRKLKSMSHEERSRLQNKYSQVLRHRNSFWNDLWIIVQTIPALLKN